MGVHNLSFYPLQCKGHCVASNILLDNSSVMDISHIYSVDHLKTTEGCLYSQMLSAINLPSYISQNYRIIIHWGIYNFNGKKSAKIKQSLPYYFNVPRRKNKSKAKTVTCTWLCLIGMSEWFIKEKWEKRKE